MRYSAVVTAGAHGSCRRGRSSCAAVSRVRLPRAVVAAVHGLRQRRPPGGGPRLPRPGRRARLHARARAGGPARLLALVLGRLGDRDLPQGRPGRRRLGRRRAPAGGAQARRGLSGLIPRWDAAGLAAALVWLAVAVPAGWVAGAAVAAFAAEGVRVARLPRAADGGRAAELDDRAHSPARRDPRHHGDARPARGPRAARGARPRARASPAPRRDPHDGARRSGRTSSRDCARRHGRRA